MPSDSITIASILRKVARGKHGHEDLSMSEAEMVFGALLDSNADPLQLGAFLIAQRMKGETSEELAGFVRAARQFVIGFGNVKAPFAIDLPSYAGKRRAAPIHMAAALKARDAGRSVVVHGVAHIEGRYSAWDALEGNGVRRAKDLADALSILDRDGITYIDLAELCPPLFFIYGLRSRLGVRSFANSVARLLNPLLCTGQVNGLFHTPFAEKMSGANVYLEQKRSIIFMGAEGEAELYADRQKVVAMQVEGNVSMLELPDCGCDPYPKVKLKPDAVAERFGDILQGRMDAREAATLARMLDAFHWASYGQLPENWKVMGG